MKRLLTVLFSLFSVLLIFTACTGESSTQNTTEGTTTVKTTTLGTTLGTTTTAVTTTTPVTTASKTAATDLARAKTLASQTVKNFYNKRSFYLKEELPDNNVAASIWDYMTMLSLTNRILEIDPTDETYIELRESLIEGLDYYGAKRSDKYKNTVYASRRTNTTWSAESEISYDDQIWLIREFLNIYESTGKEEYLTKAKKLTAFVLDEGWDEAVGGIYWMEGGTTRNTCSNAPMIKELVRLYNITKDESYLEWAKKVYAWVREYLLDKSDSLYYDFVGTTYDKNGVAIDTHAPNTDKHAYNSGSMISAGVALYEATNDTAYLNEAKATARKSFSYFVEVIKADGKGYKQFKITTNTWFNLILMIGYLDISEYATFTDNFFEAMQISIDYAFENHRKGGFIPKLYISGWGDESKKRLIDMSSNAEIYALLAQYYSK